MVVLPVPMNMLCRGVSWCARYCCWKALAVVDGHLLCGGLHKDAAAAAQELDLKILEYVGAFRKGLRQREIRATLQRLGLEGKRTIH